MATFIDAVNRVMRINHIIKGDDDNITTFADTQHAADIEIAQIAIQQELTDLVANKLLGYEKASSSISLVTGTRTYALANDFVRFYGTNPSFYDSTDNDRIYELKGGLDKLRDIDYDYDTSQGSPTAWYWEPASTNQIGLYYIPSSEYNGRSLTYEYEKSVMVTDTTDTMPFLTTEAYYAFADCAARRFKQVDGSFPGMLSQDGSWLDARSRLNDLLALTNRPRKYGRKHG